MCASACGASGTTIEEVVANLQRVVEGLAATAATTRARADMSRASVETSERALKDTLEACRVAREELCEEFASVRARGERALERLATPASVEAAKERRRAEGLRAFAVAESLLAELVNDEANVVYPQGFFQVAIDCPGNGKSAGDAKAIFAKPGAFISDIIRR